MYIKPLSYLLVPLIFLLFAALWLHLSTWFLWSLIPDGSLKLAVNYTRAGTSITSDLLPLTPLQAELQPFTSQVRRFAYVQKDRSAVIALIPRNPALFRERRAIKQNLLANNWRISNLGLVIIGTKGESSLNSVTSAVSRTYRKLYSRQYPYRPAIVAVIRSGDISPALPDMAFIGVATNNGQELKIVSAATLAELPDFSITSPPLPANDFLSFNLSGPTLQLISSQFDSQLDKVLTAKLGLTRTNPKIMALLAAQQTASLALSGQDASIAMMGDPASLRASVAAWLSNEEAYSRPQKSAFKLPDGTLGYELIKGPLQTVLSPPDAEGCEAPSTPTVNLWLCRNYQGVSLGTNRPLALQGLSNISPDHHTIAVSRQYLSQLNLPALNRINSLTLYNSDPYTVLTLKLE